MPLKRADLPIHFVARSASCYQEAWGPKPAVLSRHLSRPLFYLVFFLKHRTVAPTTLLQPMLPPLLVLPLFLVPLLLLAPLLLMLLEPWLELLGTPLSEALRVLWHTLLALSLEQPPS